jgi:hypothetical protein
LTRFGRGFDFDFDFCDRCIANLFMLFILGANGVGEGPKNMANVLTISQVKIYELKTLR